MATTMSSLPPPPPPPPSLPPPPPPPAVPPPAVSPPGDPSKNISEQVMEACRKLEIARGQEAELEALLVFASSVLAPEIPLEDLPESIQDVHEEIRQLYPDASNNDNGMTATTANNKMTSFPPPGQFGKAMETQVVASAIQSAAAQAADIYTNRLTEGPALQGLVSDIRRHNQQQQVMQQQYHAQASYEHPFLPVLDQRLAELRLYHARHGTNADWRQKRLVSDGYDLGARARQEWLSPLANDTLFAAPEVLGKYLDLERSTWITTMQQIRQYKDKKNKDSSNSNDDNKSFDYLDFLQALSQGLDNLGESAKLAHRKNYERFLVQLQEYVLHYLSRTSPLLDVKKEIIAPVMEQTVPAAVAKEGVDLDKYDSVEALQKEVDADALKAELTRLGLKCGGTPTDRAKRLWMTKGKDPSEWPSKIKAKGGATPSSTADASSSAGTSSSTPASTQKSVPLAQREAVVTALLDQVRPALEATMKRMERQQGQTLAEREAEINEDLYGSTVPTKKRKTEKHNDDDDDDDDDEDEPVYNPKNVPLDWDGKPIPYWLYKLHGLQHFYTCEICSGESYRGRRNFELHFADQKHAAGMKSLGIPNTKHFHGVTKIQDAKDLWASLQEKLKEEQFDTSKEEEYEDSHGNVLTRTTYEDLARQGLL